MSYYLVCLTVSLKAINYHLLTWVIGIFLILKVTFSSWPCNCCMIQYLPVGWSQSLSSLSLKLTNWNFNYSFSVLGEPFFKYQWNHFCSHICFPNFTALWSTVICACPISPHNYMLTFNACLHRDEVLCPMCWAWSLIPNEIKLWQFLNMA